jgi:hypothetical protein
VKIAQVRIPVPKSMKGVTKVPTELAARLARPGFEAEITPGSKELLVKRTGVCLIKGDPGAQPMPIDAPIVGQELKNLSGIVAAYEASLKG